MLIFLDESGDLGWSLDKPRFAGGSSRFITIAGIVVDQDQIKMLMHYVRALSLKHNLDLRHELKGKKISNEIAELIVRELLKLSLTIPFQIISITANKQNVTPQLRRDSNVFYNHLLNNLLTGRFYENKMDNAYMQFLPNPHFHERILFT